MLAPLPEILAERRRAGAAVAAFTCYGVEAAAAAMRTAERLDAPAMLLISARAHAGPSGDALLAALVAIADRGAAPACVQLDHVSDLDQIERALDAGAGAVMADGSQLPYAENVELCHAAAELAHRHGAHVEVELGHIAGDEELARAVESGALTDPTEAVDFVQATGASCLAVSIGNVHGRYRGQPVLDLERLERIAAGVDVPLSLHGASGLPAEVVRACIARGIAKVNVNTELRAAAFDAIDATLPQVRDGLGLLRLSETVGAALQEVMLDKAAGLAGRREPA